MIKQLFTLLLIPALCYGASAPAETQRFEFIDCGKKISRWTTLPCIALSDNNKIVGYLAHEPSEEDTNKIWIDELYTLPALRNKGYGRVLVQHFLARAAKNYKETRLTVSPFTHENPNNFVGGSMIPDDYYSAMPLRVNFYQKLGFVVTESVNYIRMAQKLMTHDQALTQVTKDLATQTVAGELA